jgi:regulatory protein
LIITKIHLLRGKRFRYGVHLNGAPALELSDWTIGKFGLRTGDDLDEQTIERIKTTDAEAQAKNIAINYLSYRPRSSKEVLTHLIKKGFTDECAETVIQQLRQLKMMDDLGFAFAFARDTLKRKPTGQALLRQKLIVKGISSSDIETVLTELISPRSQYTAALQAMKRKMQLTRHSTTKMDKAKRKKRLLDFLLRRGFSYEIAVKTLRTTLDAS